MKQKTTYSFQWDNKTRSNASPKKAAVQFPEHISDSKVFKQSKRKNVSPFESNWQYNTQRTNVTKRAASREQQQPFALTRRFPEDHTPREPAQHVPDPHWLPWAAGPTLTTAMRLEPHHPQKSAALQCLKCSGSSVSRRRLLLPHSGPLVRPANPLRRHFPPIAESLLLSHSSFHVQ